MRTMATRPGRRRFGRKVRLFLLLQLVIFSAAGLLAEVGCRLFWHPRFWVRAESWRVGSGQDRAGRKWWPGARYLVEGLEFRVRFRADARGYRARPAPPQTPAPYRVAFVGDSFTEAMQVEYGACFVSLLERGLGGVSGGREVIGENYGVAATGFFEYWHRIVHDVFRPDARAPDALVLCVYPGNDFTDLCPDDGFEPDGRPRRDYFRAPSWSRHALAWLNLKSKLAHFVFHTFRLLTMPVGPQRFDAPPYWWSDPAVAASAGETSAVRHVRELVRAIEAECDHHGTRLAILVVGPVQHYAVKGGPSPLARICADWGIKAPVIDAAALLNATPKPSRLVFSLDGHLNPEGHRALAATAQAPLAEALSLVSPPHQNRR